MKTDTLIDLLAANAGPAPRGLLLRRLVPGVAVGLIASALLALWRYGAIPPEMWAGPAPWIKLGYALALAAAGLALVDRLARPAGQPTQGLRAAIAAVLAMATLAFVSLWAADPADRMADWLGHSWTSCSVHVLLLALPALGLALWALRGLAPTRPRAAGAAAGLLAGALGAAGYTLACTEVAPSFVATWYTLGIGGAVALGALLGPRWLRW